MLYFHHVLKHSPRAGLFLALHTCNSAQYVLRHLCHINPITVSRPFLRNASSASSTRWTARASKDAFRKEALVAGLKSRAAFKLLELHSKHKLFKPGATVVDLGYAPGSWSQVAVDRTRPGGRVIGVDLIPAQPPAGVSTIQGNFLGEGVQEEVRRYVRERELGRVKGAKAIKEDERDGPKTASIQDGSSYLDLERSSTLETRPSSELNSSTDIEASTKKKSLAQRDLEAGRVVDVVLSDMWVPWPQVSGHAKNSVNSVYRRLQNVSGNDFRDHVKSMELCLAALEFAYDTLKTGGSFVCKYYQGAEDKELENRMKKLFEKVYREKPEASRKESREGFFVALRRRETATKETVLGDVVR